jgi:hypothetical protein
MKSRDFCYWLQGFFELSIPNSQGPVAFDLTAKQVLVISNHLNMVFKHEIDPSNGSPEHNAELSKIHTSGLVTTGLIPEMHLNC